MTGSSTTGRKYHRPSARDRAWIAFVWTFSGEGFDRQLRQADQTVVVHPGERPVELARAVPLAIVPRRGSCGAPRLLVMAGRRQGANSALPPASVIMGFRKGGVEIQ